MPYEADKPEDLPENVQELSKDKQDQWISVFNSVHAKCIADGKEADECETAAFQQANGVIKDSKTSSDEVVPFTYIANNKTNNEVDKLVYPPGKTTEPEPDSKAGKRNNKRDKKDLQAIHDKAVVLGADCETMGKAMDLERQSWMVRGAWHKRFNSASSLGPDDFEPMRFWVKAVFADFVIVEDTENNIILKYDYTIADDGEVTFAEPTQVEVEFVEVGKSIEPEQMTIKTFWTCGTDNHEHGTPQEAKACIDQSSMNTPAVRSEFVKSVYSNNSLKTISKTDDELTVANYMVLFGGRDLEGIASNRVNEDGSKGEYFSKSTQFDSDYTKTGQLLVDWEHRTQPDGIGPDAEDIFGYVDWKTAVADDTGLFVKRVLNRRNRYVKMLEALIDAGMLGSSSEPVQKGVVKSDDGEINEWPLKRDSFSVMPMDPRMLGTNHLEIVKALRTNPDGCEIYEKIFNVEAAIAEAKALSLANQIGENL